MSNHSTLSFILLSNQTRNKGAWTRTRSVCAANPSSLGTHWFVNENRYEGFVDEGKFINSSSCYLITPFLYSMLNTIKSLGG